MTLQQEITISNIQFLTAIFGDQAPFTHIASFPEPPDKLDDMDLRHRWGGGVANSMNIEVPENNNFFVISTFLPDAQGNFKRRKAQFRATFCIMVDDIGSGPGAKISERDFRDAGAPEPSWILETSPGNTQWGYIFEQYCVDPKKVSALLKGMVALDLVDDGSDPGMMGVTRYCRLPAGTNNKSKYDAPFQHRLLHWAPDQKVDIDVLAQNLGIDLRLYTNNLDGTYPEPLAIADDHMLAALHRQGLLKYQKDVGEYEVTCPWASGHTQELDNGAMYFSPTGYKCWHGSCNDRSGNDLRNWMYGKDPEYKLACDVPMPFQPVIEDQRPVPDNILPFTTTPRAPGYDQVLAKIAALDTKSPPEMLTDIYRDIAASNFDKAANERLYAAIKAEPPHFGLAVSRDAVAEQRRLISAQHMRQGLIGSPNWQGLHENERPMATTKNFQAMLDFHGITITFNQMSHEATTVIPNVINAVEDRDNLDIRCMKDLMASYEMYTSECEEFMNAVAHANSYHPFEAYLDAADPSKYDPNCPMFMKLIDTIDFDCDRESAIVFIRKWLISVIAAVKGHLGFGMKGVLVFAGPQNIGKTSWFRYLTPPDMFGEGMHVDPHDKDTVLKATKYLISELGELDSTLKRDIAALKSLISNSVDEIRQPYARRSSKIARRTVLCGTVNQDDFLRDGTGNSRFWPISVTGFDLPAMEAMVKSGEMQQLWFEVWQMYLAFVEGNAAFDWRVAVGDNSNKLLEDLSANHHEETAVAVFMNERFDFDSPLVNPMTMSEILYAIGVSRDKLNGPVTKQIREFISLRTKQRKAESRRVNGEMGRYWIMPAERVTASGGMPFKPQLEVVPSPSEDEPDFI